MLSWLVDCSVVDFSYVDLHDRGAGLYIGV
jgi:hypothetical protein